jgi:hypothetical protein
MTDIFATRCWRWAKIGGTAAWIYVAWLFIHHGAAWCYAQYCIPRTVYGLLVTPFLIPSPLCSGLRWCVVQGAEMVGHMWVAFGSWVIAMIALGKKPTHTD